MIPNKPIMTVEEIIRTWFEKWEKGKFRELPLSEQFSHTSPFGTIEGKDAYLELVERNQDKFLGYEFQIEDGIYEENRACVRYIARQGKDFKLDVSEWYYLENGNIQKIIAHYHIGEIRQERMLQ
ncbi:MAG: nuclear transport factor 2 family protein [Christiangramia sp.]|uniref:nuclear transport factor 2 family protein n=1 Tax=Christiangramia sp. TaxID=1931228 RepID=UPI0032426E26